MRVLIREQPMSAGCPIAVHDISGLAVEFCERLSASHRREMREGGRVSRKPS